MEENELNLEDLDLIEAEAENKLKVKNRFQTLSEKVKITAQEKEETESRLKAESEARLQAEKERDFFKTFSSQATNYPNASQHQDKIWEKVRAGYDVEDAIVSVLNKEAQNAPQEAPVQRSSPTAEGGSAQTQISEMGSKDLRDMSMEDKLKALMELEKQGNFPRI